MFEITGKYTTAKVMIDDVEETAISQIYNFVNHPAFTNPIAIMPDVHAGKGSCIGFVMPMTDKLIANIVGVDIACGMLSINIGKELPLSLEHIDHKIRQRIPFGYNIYDKSILNTEREFPWQEVNSTMYNFYMAYQNKFNKSYSFPKYNQDYLQDTIERIGADAGRIYKSIGTLGGGNHFLEFGKDDNDNFWITVHTGSRNFGKCVCDYWQNKAIHIVKKEKQEKLRMKIDTIRSTYKGMEIKKQIRKAREELGLDEKVNSDLMYLEGEYAWGYLCDMIFAQKYAEVNRKYIVHQILDILNMKIIDSIETLHNFIDFRDFTIRKGAIRSYVGERMIIPFNPRDGILVCEGKSNPEWNYSAPHGAGRLMSRSKAKEIISDEDAEKALDGIFASQKPKDESPLAYKDSKIIEEAIEPTAKILFKIKPILNMKAGDDSE